MKYILFFLASLIVSATAAEKVGGTYRVQSIERSEQGFQLTLASEPSTGKFDTLRMQADHVHFGLKEGEVFRISAEIGETKEGVTSIRQLVVFFPGQQGPVPVWMVAKGISPKEPTAAKMIEMHAPQSDFRLF